MRSVLFPYWLASSSHARYCGARQHTAGELRPHHQHVVLGHLALVPVILLIDAVKLQELVIVLGKPVRGGVRQGLGNGPAKQGISRLQTLVSGQLQWFTVL